MRYIKALSNTFGLFVALSTVAGCTSKLAFRQVPFEHGSTDFSQGQPQEFELRGRSLEDAMRSVHDLATKRGLTLMDKNCSSNRCSTVYEFADDPRAKTIGGGSVHDGSGSMHVHTVNVDFGSRYFFEFEQGDGDVLVSAAGVPRVNTEIGCPKVLEKRKKCQPEPFNVQGDSTPAESFKGIWGVDISGKREHDLITGVFAELDLQAPAPVAVPVASAPEAEEPESDAESVAADAATE